jgi:hypothetical protein
MIIFSFCIYGNGLKYYLGLVENVIVINKYYPDAYIHIYVGKNHNKEFIDKMKDKNYDNIAYIETGIEGAINTYYRYKSIISYEGCGGCTNNVFISRDTDSCINDRDRWCINDFLNEEYEKYYFQVIRDHYWHKSKLLAGLTCFVDDGSDRFNTMRNEFKKNFDIIEMTINSNSNNYNYGCDEEILNNKIYPIIKDNLIVYTNICAYAGENVKNINYENDNYNFVGNVIEYELDGQEVKKRYVFKYDDFNLVEHIKWLMNEKQFKLIITTINDCNSIVDDCNSIVDDCNSIVGDCNSNMNRLNTSVILDYKYIAYYYSQQLKECMDIYKDFYKYDITEHIKNNSMYVYTLAKEKGYKIVGTCNVNYEPKIDEIVIYFGNYADDYMALPQSNKIYIHVIYLEKFIKIVDIFVYDECWNDIERIYIMTLENEFERLTETLLQLCLMNAPLNKLYIYKAKKDVNLVDIYVGATNNHLHCLYHMLTTASIPIPIPTTTAPNRKSCLFLEDDFIFTTVIEDNKKKLKLFFNRNYDYDICFLSASKYHKREDYDDLLILSKQICTTSSGYLINYKNIEKIYNIVKEGNELLKITGDSNSYCIDRYWCKLCNDNKVFIFKNKLGFQKPSQSKITGTYNCNLD